jgi:anaerobic selenocysteine-containing dehydrogenase
MPETTVCRLCDAACGVLVHSESGRLSSITTDPADPVGGGEACPVLAYVPSVLAHPDRITTPLRRTDSGWESVPWEDALAAIGDQLRSIRGQSGPESLGLYLGGDRWSRSRETVRALALGVALGTPHLFSETADVVVPSLRAAEHMLGHPAPLLSDLSRAHYVVVFDGGQVDTGWGGLRRGRIYGEALAHSVRTKGTKVVVVGPRRTPLADTAHQYVAIRPGTESFFLLGMLSAAVKGLWRDDQDVRDYTEGWPQLQEILSGWSVERCAAICGVDAAQISGVALKFGRAAMAVAHLDARVYSSPYASVGAWAGLALHTITANTLRPGGLYDHLAPFDLHHPLAFLPSEKSPRTHSGHPLVALQAPAATLTDHLDGTLKALVVVEGDPAGTAADPRAVQAGLGSLDLLVVCAGFHSATTASADWVLPTTHPFEEQELEVLGSFSLPEPAVRQVRPAVQAPEGCWPAEHILRQLGQAVHPGLRGSVYGLHLALAGRHLAGAPLDDWESRLLEWAADIDPEALDAPPHRIDRGMADRSLQRVGRDGGKILLAPDAVRLLLDAVVPPGGDGLRLRTSVPRSNAPDARHGRASDAVAYVHPDVGLATGAAVRITTEAGFLDVTVRHDPRLRPDVVDLPAGVPGVGALIPRTPRDPWTGMPARDGLSCQVELLS